MPAKSRHNRRKIQSKRAYNPETFKTIPGTTDSNTIALPKNISRPVNADSKISAYANVVSSDVINEIKWIGFVTGIVLICLVVAYIFVK